jgi:hypothetical protein
MKKITVNFKGKLTPHLKYMYNNVKDYVDYTLKDGREVHISGGVKVGGLVLTGSDESNLVPIEAGDHELADGIKITVTDGGLISKVSKENFNKFSPGIKARRYEKVKELAETLSKRRN